MNFRHIYTVLILLISFLSYNCSKNDNISDSIVDNLILSYYKSDSLSLDNNTMLLDTIKLLMKGIKFVKSNANDSLDFHTGPFKISPGMIQSVSTISSMDFPEGNYNKIRFEVHKPDTNEVLTDPEFSDTSGRFSLIAKGSFNGNRFIYKSKYSAWKILQFVNQVSISGSGTTNITLLIKPYIWFLNNGDFVDPREPGNSVIIDNNIKNNFNNGFSAFTDNDRNGIPD